MRGARRGEARRGHNYFVAAPLSERPEFLHLAACLAVPGPGVATQHSTTLKGERALITKRCFLVYLFFVNIYRVRSRSSVFADPGQGCLQAKHSALLQAGLGHTLLRFAPAAHMRTPST